MSQYYAQRPPPCPCGSREAYWHGPEDGLREFLCDACWNSAPPSKTEDEAFERIRKINAEVARAQAMREVDAAFAKVRAAQENSDRVRRTLDAIDAEKSR